MMSHDFRQWLKSTLQKQIHLYQYVTSKLIIIFTAPMTPSLCPANNDAVIPHR